MSTARPGSKSVRVYAWTLTVVGLFMLLVWMLTEHTTRSDLLMPIGFAASMAGGGLRSVAKALARLEDRLYVAELDLRAGPPSAEHSRISSEEV